MANEHRDNLFEGTGYPHPFSFNTSVAKVFDNMAKRSIPYYQDVHHIIQNLAPHFCKDSFSKIYDIGCSTGTSLLSLSQSLNHSLQLVGIDSSQAMLEEAKKKLENIKKIDKLQLFCQNALDHHYEYANMILCNYTMQFIPIEHRLHLLKKFHSGLKEGGILFLSEKIRYENLFLQETISSIYEDYKLENGYGRIEIERKKLALEKVLIPLTLEEQIACMKEAGFTEIEIAFKWHCFVSIMAIR